jgi:hypothetical protein
MMEIRNESIFLNTLIFHYPHKDIIGYYKPTPYGCQGIHP